MEFSPVVALLPKWQVLDRVSKQFLPLIIWLNCSVPKTPQDDCFLDRLDFTSEHDVLHTTRADLVHLSIMWCMDTDRIRKMRIKWVKRNSEFKLKCNIEMWKWLPWRNYIFCKGSCLAVIPTQNPNSKVHNSKIDWRRWLLLTSLTTQFSLRFKCSRRF